MTAEDDYPELYQLFGGGFNQDWQLDVGEGGDWPEVIDEFVDGQGPDQAREALRELDQLLATGAEDAELDRTLDALGCAYLPDAGRTREWLVAIRDRLAAATQ